MNQEQKENAAEEAGGKVWESLEPVRSRTGASWRGGQGWGGCITGSADKRKECRK